MIKRFLMVALLLVAPYTHAQSLGPERVQNGSFDTTDAWTLGYGWQILPYPGSLAFRNEGSSSPIEQPIDLTGATIYRVSYKVSGTYTSSDPRHWFRVRSPSGYVSCPIYSGDGTFGCDIVAPAGVMSILIRPVYGFSGVLDDVSVREVLP